MDMNGELRGACPVCGQGDLITITMAVNGSDLHFTTCHMCEAKWWYRDGEAVPLTSVIGAVISHRA
jgi:formate dehydrogenase maturation protein FdhE